MREWVVKREIWTMTPMAPKANDTKVLPLEFKWPYICYPICHSVIFFYNPHIVYYKKYSNTLIF